MDRRHMKRCSTSLTIRETQSNHNEIPLHAGRMTIIFFFLKKLVSVDKVMEKFLYWWWEYNRLQPLWITVWQFLKIVNIVTT